MTTTLPRDPQLFEDQRNDPEAIEAAMGLLQAPSTHADLVQRSKAELTDYRINLWLATDLLNIKDGLMSIIATANSTGKKRIRVQRQHLDYLYRNDDQHNYKVVKMNPATGSIKVLYDWREELACPGPWWKQILADIEAAEAHIEQQAQAAQAAKDKATISRLAEQLSFDEGLPDV